MKPSPAEARAYLDALLQQAARAESLAAENAVLRGRGRPGAEDAALLARVRELEGTNETLRAERDYARQRLREHLNGVLPLTLALANFPREVRPAGWHDMGPIEQAAWACEQVVILSSDSQHFRKTLASSREGVRKLRAELDSLQCSHEPAPRFPTPPNQSGS